MDKQAPGLPEDLIVSKNSRWKTNTISWIVLGIVVLAAIGVGVYAAVQNFDSPKINTNQNNFALPSAPPTPSSPPNLRLDAPSSAPSEPGAQDFGYSSASCKNRLPVTGSKSGMVTWQEPKFLKDEVIFASSSPGQDGWEFSG